MPGSVATFSYHRRLSPMLGALLGLAVVEALVLHLVAMAWWGWRVAVAIGLADAALIGLLVWFLRSLQRSPIRIEHDALILHTGARLHVRVPLGAIAGFREGWTAADLKQRDLLNMALVAWPTVVLDLDPPVQRRRRSVRAVAHCVDDPDRFREAVTRAKAAQAPA